MRSELKAIMEVRGIDKDVMQLFKTGIAYGSSDPDRNPGYSSWGPIHSVSLEDGQDLEKRITLTRVALLGVFALAVKKKSGGTKYVTVEGDGFFWAMEVDRKHVKDAQRFVMQAKSIMATS